MFAITFRLLRRLRRPAGLGLAALVPTLLLGWLFWYEVTAEAPRETLLRQGESKAGNIVRKHGRSAPLRSDLVFLGIDDATLKLDSVWPEEIDASLALKLMSESRGDLNWSRQVYALLLDRVLNAGARLVIFDMVFPNPGRGDDAFRDALDRHKDRVVIGTKFIDTPGRWGDEAWQATAESLVADPANDPRVGYVNYWPDLDGAIRLALLRTTQTGKNGRAPQADEPVYTSLIGSALRQLGRADLLPPVGTPKLFRYTDIFHGVNYPARPLWEIFSDAAWKGNYQNGAYFKDKVVLVGAAAPILHDDQPTPSGQILGPALQLQALTAALSQDYLHLTSIWTDLGLILAAGGLAWATGQLIRQPLARLAVLVAISVAFIAVLIALYNAYGLMPLAFTPLLVFNSGGLAGLIGEYAVERAEKARVRGVLDRLVSKDIVRELLENRESYEELVRGVRRPVTVLFSDVRGFTTLSEAADDPRAFIAQLNEYLGEMVDVVFKHKGTLDKFIGDAVMAVWGSMHTEGVDADACKAVAAALEMRTRLAALNEKWAREGKLPLDIGIGLNHGDAMVGGLGSEDSKMEITVIGDAVNLASRLESLTKEYGLGMLIGESVARIVSESYRLRTVDLVRVKGKKKPSEVMAVLGPLTDVPSEAQEYLLADYEDAILLYRRQEFAAAVRLLEECQKTDPSDRLVALYLERCRELLAAAPAADWDGVKLMTTK